MKKHGLIKYIMADKRVYLVILALVFLFGGALVLWAVVRGDASVNTASSVSAQTTSRVIDPLTGVLMETHAPYRDVFGVMIDGHVDARPVSGIDQAFLVIEAPVEAGIPRTLAFFAKDTPVEKIGPVRSARPYFLDWASELDALYVHVGGSPAALEKIETGSTFDLNQFWHGEQFWRDSRRFAPHNVYTSKELLGTYVDGRRAAGKVSEPLYGVWTFLETNPEVGTHGKIPVSFGDPEYAFVWEFDSESKTYVRTQDGNSVRTREGGDISTNNLIVMTTEIEILDAIGRRRVKTVGSGQAKIYQFGNVIEGTWKKEKEADRLRFFDERGEEVKMVPGKTWIEVVGNREQ